MHSYSHLYVSTICIIFHHFEDNTLSINDVYMMFSSDEQCSSYLQVILREYFDMNFAIIMDRHEELGIGV